MQKYIYGDVLLYAREHTIKEIQEFFCFPNYGATKRYLLLHNIKHLAEMCSKGQRRFHKLTEWSGAFITWARELPYAQELLFLDELEEK